MHCIAKLLLGETAERCPREGPHPEPEAAFAAESAGSGAPVAQKVARK